MPLYFRKPPYRRGASHADLAPLSAPPSRLQPADVRAGNIFGSPNMGRDWNRKMRVHFAQSI